MSWQIRGYARWVLYGRPPHPLSVVSSCLNLSSYIELWCDLDSLWRTRTPMVLNTKQELTTKKPSRPVGSSWLPCSHQSPRGHSRRPRNQRQVQRWLRLPKPDLANKWLPSFWLSDLGQNDANCIAAYSSPESENAASDMRFIQVHHVDIIHIYIMYVCNVM